MTKLELVKLSDNELVQIYKDSDYRLAFEVIYERHQKRVYSICIAILGDTQAEDACSEILCKLIIDLKRYEIQNFIGWLNQISRNHCIQILKKEKRLPITLKETLPENLQNDSNDTLFDEEANLRLFNNCMKNLQSHYKECIELFYGDNKMTYDEIAKHLDIKWNSVKDRIKTGRDKLIECVKKSASK